MNKHTHTHTHTHMTLVCISISIYIIYIYIIYNTQNASKHTRAFVYSQRKYSVESPGLNEEVTRRRHLGLTFHRYLSKLKSAQVPRNDIMHIMHIMHMLWAACHLCCAHGAWRCVLHVSAYVYAVRILLWVHMCTGFWWWQRQDYRRRHCQGSNVHA